MSRICITLADQRYSNIIADLKEPANILNRAVNRPQRACENRPNMSLLFLITSLLVIPFKNGAAQTRRLSIPQKEFKDSFFWGPLVSEHLHVSILLIPGCQAWICLVLRYAHLDTPGLLTNIASRKRFSEIVKDTLG